MRNRGFQSNQIQPVVQFPVASLDHALLQHGFEKVTATMIPDFHALADELIEGEVANAGVLWRVQEWTGRSLHLRYGKNGPNALLASIPLTRAGRKALLAGKFGFANARQDWVCDLTQPADALLSWGMAGRTGRDQTAALRGLLAGWHGFYHDITVYARGRSSAGRQLLRRLGFRLAAAESQDSPLFASTGIPGRLDQHLSQPAMETRSVSAKKEGHYAGSVQS